MARNRHKKSFTCGHKGFGKFCHRCRQADQLLSQVNAIGGTLTAEKMERRRELMREAARLKASDGQPTKAQYEAVGFSERDAQILVSKDVEPLRQVPDGTGGSTLEGDSVG